MKRASGLITVTCIMLSAGLIASAQSARTLPPSGQFNPGQPVVPPPPNNGFINDTNTAGILLSPYAVPSLTPGRTNLSPATTSGGIGIGQQGFGTAIGPQTNQPAIGQQGFGTAIGPQSNQPAIGQQGFGTAIGPQSNQPAIGQQGSGTAIGQQGTIAPPPRAGTVAPPPRPGGSPMQPAGPGQR